MSFFLQELAPIPDDSLLEDVELLLEDLALGGQRMDARLLAVVNDPKPVELIVFHSEYIALS